MNKKFAIWVVGGLVTASVFGLGVSPTIASAAEKAPQACEAQTNQMGAMMGNMNPKAMAEMMKTPEMQKQCIEMMKNPEMQKAMKDVMKTPEMQGIMKQMLQQDMSFHQMMSDLVNSVDMSSNHSGPQQVEKSPSNPSNAHSSHHG
ncbi:GerD family protein [Sporomusa sp.]|uniref:GerD family protein n=1 Tax=Sporomusa sp. TaxID=2078658 RepID=UPI002C7D2AC2|nr:GerD family protein [Sporomusa sp.]HWR43442.1 GerD family protein [Sporomusa sp.]